MSYARGWSRFGTISSGHRATFWLSFPDRVETDASRSVFIHRALSERLSKVEREVFGRVAVFCAGSEANIEGVRKLTARGVKVRVLTNSAASTNVIAAHAGYENTREKLLKLVRATSFVRIPTWKDVVVAGG